MVVAIPVAEGDEVAEGDVVAVVESMKMETSLTAPFAGRVRRVLTGTNVQVPAHTPLLQLEAIEDEAAEQSAERVDVQPRRAAGGGDRGRARPPALDAARLRRQRRRGPPRARRSCASACDAELLAGEHRLLDVYTDVRALEPRPHDDPERELLHSPQEYLHAFLRSLDAKAERLPERFVTLLQRALSHYGVESLDRTPALEEACYRLFVSQERADLARAAVMAILERRLERADELVGAGRRRVPRRARPARARHRAPRPGDRRPRPPAAQPLLRPAADRRSARPQAYAELECHLTALLEDPDRADRAEQIDAVVDGAAAAGAAAHRPHDRDRRARAPGAAGDHDPPLVPRSAS